MERKSVPNPMRGSQPFKLGLFSMNTEGGVAFTKVENRWRADWDPLARTAKMADKAGLDFLLPVARWKGFGGEGNVRGDSFEALTQSAGLAAITERIAILSTVHVPLVHPLFSAKSLMTIDNISHGRAGVNIVCGWNQSEFAMFGHEPVPGDARYDQGREWLEIVSRVARGEGPFDYNGAHYQLKGVEGGPAIVQKPGIFSVSAAFSTAGRAFAFQYCDALFTVVRHGGEKDAALIAEIKQQAKAYRRDIGVMTSCYVVCRETDKEAEDYHRYFAEEMADNAAIDFHMGSQVERHAKYDPDVQRVERMRFAGGSGMTPLIGSPQRVADGIIELHKLGLMGTGLSFVNFEEELPFFVERVLPLLEQAGIRLKI
jgi:alkanesulfonate monooxygenase SsuD/methylene tetrahydromethanopterin reductase-like flavin-dependent oxidoreductase (luciferase family)